MKILLFGIDKKYAQEKFKLKSLITNKNMFMNKNKDIYYITDNEGDLIGQRFDIIIDYRPIELLSRLNEINLQNYHIGDNYFICEKQTFELEQELAELKEKYNKASEKLKNITEEVENNFVHGQDYEKLKQELAELKEKDNYHLRYELAGADETITNLKEQLAEKDIRIEELEGQFAYECECNKQLVELQKQLEEKQNTIDEINKEFVQAVHDWKTLCAEKDKEIEKLKQQNTLLENENGKLAKE